jgi:hypothetical protein
MENESPKFTLDDAEYSMDSPVAPRIAKAIAILDALPDGKLVTTRRMAQLMEIADFHDDTADPAIRDYREFDKKKKLVWGSKKTIQLFREWKNGRDNAQ